MNRRMEGRGGRMPRRSRRDRGMMRDGHYRPMPRYGYAEFGGRYGEMPYSPDYGEMGGDYERAGQSRRGGSRSGSRRDMRGRRDYGYEPMDYGYDDDYGYDYGMDYGEEKLSSQDLTEWMHDLMDELDHDEKEVFKKERALQRAKEMGVEFSKYSEMEFYVTFLMCYTDYKRTIGKGNMEYALSLAKEWLEDKDAGVKYGEKLAVYYDSIVCAEE